jgi:hypothetical protein
MSGPLSLTVDQAKRYVYQTNAVMVAQQKQNRLRPAVTILPATGEAQSAADLLGASTASRSDARSRTNPDNMPNRTRRWLVQPEDICEDGVYIDKSDKLAMVFDPASQLMTNQIAGVERLVFDTILGIEETGPNTGTFQIAANGGGILGAAREGKTPSSTVALPGGNTIAAAATGLTLTKIIAAVEAMQVANFGIEDDDPLYALISPKQKTNLLQIASATGTALNQFEQQQLVSGKPTMLMGINWILSNRVPKNASAEWLVPIWSKKNIVVGMWQETMSDIWNDTHNKNLPYVYTSAILDAVRVQDGGVRVIACV